ncbi:MAG: cyanophycin synthetase [Pirellulaceae bacterium]
MYIKKIRILRGPNVWDHRPVLEATIEWNGLEDVDGDTIAAFERRLRALTRSLGETDLAGLFECVSGKTGPSRVMALCALLAIRLEMASGTDVTPMVAIGSFAAGCGCVAIPYEEEVVGRECIVVSHQMCIAAWEGKSYDVAAVLVRLREISRDACIGPSTRSIVRAAQERGIPFRRLNRGGLIQFGYGVRQRRICCAETDRTSAIAVDIAQDKQLTRELLKSVGVPVPAGRPVSSVEDAWAAAEELGLPVVVKPRCGNQGRGVTTNVTTFEQVEHAYIAALEEEPTVVVERFARGADYRLLVVGDRMVAAAKRAPAQVVGDGRCTVEQLVAHANEDVRRSDNHATCLSKIYIDRVAETVLREQSLACHSIPALGQIVLVRRNGNLSTGGTAEDVTDRVHPLVAARAVEAARMVGLDLAGVDVVAEDIGRPLEEQDGVVVEVNAAPGLRMHAQPSSGAARPVGEAIMALLYPNGARGRVPIAMISGVNGKTTTARLVAHLAGTIGRCVGMTCSDGIYVGNRRIEVGDCAGPQSARAILMNPSIDVAVLECARGGILREGLGCDECDVAVITNIGEGDHLGIGGVETLADLARVKRTLVKAVSAGGTAVLNAMDSLVVAMAPYCAGSVTYFALDENLPLLRNHLSTGGRAVFVRAGSIIMADGAHERVVARLTDVPLTRHGRIMFQVENVLAAVAAAWGLGVDDNIMRRGLATFDSNFELVPGRFNVVEVNGATVVLDYGHNPSAMRALAQALDHFPHARRVCVMSAAGDRGDDSIMRQAELMANACDEFILYETAACQRGRADGEIFQLLRRGLAKGNRAARFREISGELPAIEAALKELRPGLLLLVIHDKVDRSLEFVTRYLQTRSWEVAAEHPGRHGPSARLVERARELQPAV